MPFNDQVGCVCISVAPDIRTYPLENPQIVFRIRWKTRKYTVIIYLGNISGYDDEPARVPQPDDGGQADGAVRYVDLNPVIP